MAYIFIGQVVDVGSFVGAFPYIAVSYGYPETSSVVNAGYMLASEPLHNFDRF